MTHATGSFLCIPCLEKRLGRPLQPDDLREDDAGSPINTWMSWRDGQLVLIPAHKAWAALRRQFMG
jgi:hypothetical protein